MRLILKVILAILQFIRKNLNDIDAERRKLLHLKATHPKLYKKAKDEVAIDDRRDVFNLNLSMGRQVIERAFGMMISRFDF